MQKTLQYAEAIFLKGQYQPDLSSGAKEVHESGFTCYYDADEQAVLYIYDTASFAEEKRLRALAHVVYVSVARCGSISG